jgi:hypothetical protein
VIIRLELLGYEYRGVEYPNNGVCVMYADPTREHDDTLLMPGPSLDYIWERISEMPILTTDPVARMVEMRNRRKVEPQVSDPVNQRATEQQCKFLFAIGRESGLSPEEVEEWSLSLYGGYVDQLNRRDASTLIEALQRKRSERA